MHRKNRVVLYYPPGNRNYSIIVIHILWPVDLLWNKVEMVESSYVFLPWLFFLNHSPRFKMMAVAGSNMNISGKNSASSLSTPKNFVQKSHHHQKFSFFPVAFGAFCWYQVGIFLLIFFGSEFFTIHPLPGSGCNWWSRDWRGFFHVVSLNFDYRISLSGWFLYLFGSLNGQ